MNLKMILRALILFTVTTSVYGDVYRLSNNVKPIRYHVTLEPHLRDLDPMGFDGSVVINLQILEKTKIIVLNQANLTIDESSIAITNSRGERVKISATSSSNADQFYKIELEDELVKDATCTLVIEKFTGILGSKVGFFSGFYDDAESLRSFAGTQFEATIARTAFPCFDEPNFKARFIISIIRKANYNSLSNEELEKTEDLGDGRFKDTFKQTPLISTYIIAITVTDFKASEKLDRHRIFARPQAIDDGEWKYSLQISNKTLKALEEYTGIDYVLDKMDQIAFPDQYFAPAAMENWGLVIYGDSNLLRNDQSTAEQYQRTTVMIAHEFAHQWFGNLVTPASWGYLWLSEAFAVHFQYVIANMIQPTWRLNDQYLTETVHQALMAETMYGAHPLNFESLGADELPPNYIIYLKGSTIARMMEHFLTSDVFRRGLQIYLKKNKFGNTVPSDLYAALQQAVDTAGKNHLLGSLTVSQIMQTWDSNKGFPIISVKRDYKTGCITLKQETQVKEDDNVAIIPKWNIPINYVFSAEGKLDFDSTTADYWLTEYEATINKNFPTDGWVIVNKQETGYYRVNYDLENWERIIKILNSEDFESMNVLNRAQLLDDAFELAANKLLPWEIPIKLSKYLVRETDYVPFSAFYMILEKIINLPEYIGKGLHDTLLKNSTLEKPTEEDVFKEYIRATLAGVKERLGFKAKPNDSHIDQLHRTKLNKYVQLLLD